MIACVIFQRTFQSLGEANSTVTAEVQRHAVTQRLLLPQVCSRFDEVHFALIFFFFGILAEAEYHPTIMASCPLSVFNRVHQSQDQLLCDKNCRWERSNEWYYQEKKSNISTRIFLSSHLKHIQPMFIVRSILYLPLETFFLEEPYHTILGCKGKVQKKKETN